MNALSSYIQAHRLNWREVMNQLQEHGIVSDLCVEIADIGNPTEAVAWLQKSTRPGARGQ